MGKLSTQNKILIGLVVVLVAAAILIAARNQTWTQITDLFKKEETPVVAEIGELTPYSNDTTGLSLQIPANWISRETNPGLTIASSERALGIETFDDLQADGVLVIIPGEIDVLEFQSGDAFTGRDPMSLLTLYVQLLEKEGQEYLGVVPPQLFQADDQPGAKVVFQSLQGETTLEIIMAAVVNAPAGYVAFVSTAANVDNAAALRPTFEAVLNTIHVEPPGAVQ